jgi:hypothetical protein
MLLLVLFVLNTSSNVTAAALGSSPPTLVYWNNRSNVNSCVPTLRATARARPAPRACTQVTAQIK